MADKVTDSSNNLKEQVEFYFCYIQSAHGEFVGLYQVDLSMIESDTTAHVLKDQPVHLNLPVTNCRGQCYDGAANMHGWCAQWCYKTNF